MRRVTQHFSTRLPAWSNGQNVLAVCVRLSQSGKEYRYSPVVAEIVLLRVRVGGHDQQLVPVPDPQQYGNTQHAGCPWVVYKIVLSARHSEQEFEFAVHSYVPPGVDARIEAWTVKQWWADSPRPEANGYYGDAPS